MSDRSSGTDTDGPARGQQHVPFERPELLIVLRPHHGGHLSRGRHVVGEAELAVRALPRDLVHTSIVR